MPATTSRPRPRRSRRPAARRPVRRRPVSWRFRAVVLAGLAGCAVAAWALIARWTAPEGNTAQQHFDAVVVLGARADSDGNPTPTMLARVSEGVREYQRGVAPRLILTGGADHEPFVEARVMERVAEAQGVPAADIVLEPDALDTIQNACFVTRLLKARGWRSAEVVTSRRHAPRAEMVFSKEPLAWRVHVAPSLERGSALSSSATATLELLKTVRYLLYAQWAERCSP